MRRNLTVLAVCLLAAVLFTGCGQQNKNNDEWLNKAAVDAVETPGDLYEKALEEDVLIVYTVTTRITQVKEAFENDYPGLSVEVRDLRSPNLVDAVENNYTAGGSDCDVVVCSDNSGDFKARLVDTGIVVRYLPEDIGKHLKNNTRDDQVPSFINEAEMLFYDSGKYETCPISNIWELTESKYSGRIYMPNPLRSFSTYTLCSSVFQPEASEELEKAYGSYFGHEAEDGDVAAKLWTMIAANTVFTNSSDEVVEALSNGKADFGFLVSSKLRLKDIGMRIQPVYKLVPFSGCRTSYSVTLARNSKNINTAKLFIRYLYGEADGKGKGYQPFITPGTWSARDDVADGDMTALEDIDLIIPDTDFIMKQKGMEEFWTGLLEK